MASELMWFSVVIFATKIGAEQCLYFLLLFGAENQ